MKTINIGITENIKYVLGTPNTVSISINIPPLIPIPSTPSYISIWLSLRKIRFNYNGPCLKVRRDSDNLEQDIGFNSFDSLDESSLLEFCGSSNGYVTRWYNQCNEPLGQEYVSQQSAGSQPKIVTNGIMVRNSAGLPAIRCDYGKELFITYPDNTRSFTEKHCFCGIVLERDQGINASNRNMYGVGMSSSSGASYNFLFTGYNDGSVFYIWGLPNRPTANPKAWQWMPDPKHYYICAASSINFDHLDRGSITTHESIYETIDQSVIPVDQGNLQTISVTCYHLWQVDFLEGWLSEVIVQCDPSYGWTHQQMIDYHANASAYWSVPSW